jgi:hypothetical protein
MVARDIEFPEELELDQVRIHPDNISQIRGMGDVRADKRDPRRRSPMHPNQVLQDAALAP